MNELEYNIEVLCTCYSLEELEKQCKRLCDGISDKGSNDLINNVSIEVLNQAISCYDKEEYVHIRREMKENRVKHGIVWNELY